jgi:hypothetical protein
VTISQPDVRRECRITGRPMAYTPIGLTVLTLAPEAGPQLLSGNFEALAQSSYWNKRDVSLQASVRAEDVLAGKVLLVPSTYEPEARGLFWLTAGFDRGQASGVRLEPVR